MGRKPIPVEQYIDKLEQAILLGATYQLAALYAGISVATFDTWRTKAETAPAGTPLAQLRERLCQAEGRAAIGWLAKIEKAATEGNWQAASWKLERRYPESYGRTVQSHGLTTELGEGLTHLLQVAQKARNGDTPPPAITNGTRHLPEPA